MDYLTVFDSHLQNMEYADHQKNFFPIHFDSCQDPLLIQIISLYRYPSSPTNRSISFATVLLSCLGFIKTTDFNIFLVHPRIFHTDNARYSAPDGVIP